ncbi:MAG TPA: STAS domain-containing protein [Gammaproteobacteria bacterium]|nr:STAS domain-containing protein [Gammaproteobacteria bacterium]
MSLVLLQHSNTQWSLKGPLNVDTIRRIWRKGHEGMKQTPGAEIVLDLSQISDPDSASVALLVDWLRYAKRHQKTIRLNHVPKKMQDIIRLSNLQDILV